jgi:hypothetical protein
LLKKFGGHYSSSSLECAGFPCRVRFQGEMISFASRNSSTVIFPCHLDGLFKLCLCGFLMCKVNHISWKMLSSRITCICRKATGKAMMMKPLAVPSYRVHHAEKLCEVLVCQFVHFAGKYFRTCALLFLQEVNYEFKIKPDGVNRKTHITNAQTCSN